MWMVGQICIFCVYEHVEFVCRMITFSVHMHAVLTLFWPAYNDPSLPKAVPNMWFSNGTCSSAFLVLSSYIIIIYIYIHIELLIYLLLLGIVHLLIPPLKVRLSPEKNRCCELFKQHLDHKDNVLIPIFGHWGNFPLVNHGMLQRWVGRWFTCSWRIDIS